MTYAHIAGAAVDQVGRPPALAFDGTRWWDLRTLDPATLAACDWYPVVESPRPADTATDTYDPAYAVTGSSVAQSWTPRPWTAEELAAQAEAAAYEARRLTVKAIIADLRAEKTRAQAVIDTPNATIKTNPAPYVVDVARAAKRIADAAIDLARYVAP